MKGISSAHFAEFVAEKMTAGLVVLDADLLVQSANKAFCEIFGLRTEEIVGGNVLDVFPLSELAKDLPRQLDERPESDRPQRFECTLADGTTRWVRIRSWRLPADEADDSEKADSKERILLLVDDLTETTQLQAQAHLSERGFRDIIEHTPDGIGIHRDGVFLYVNPAFLEKFGARSSEEVVGRWVYDFVHPDERPALQERVRRMLTTGEIVPMRETILLRADGSEWVADLTGRVVFYQGQEAIVSIARDITEQKRLAARAMQMDRMIAAGTLAAGVGHEINNPLSYVTTNLIFSLRRIEELRATQLSPALDQELAMIGEALDDAAHGSERIGDIVKQLRSFAPQKKNLFRPVALRPAIQSALDIAANELRHRAELFVDGLDDSLVVQGNHNRLAQVFLNLLINAAHAIDDGPAAQNEVRLSARRQDDFVVVEVSDTGAGIADELRPRIFDPFFTTKAVGRGTGLGLYVCQQIIEAHGGKIEVESKLGRGSLFRVHLPAASSPPDASAPDRTLSPVQNTRILIVDDEPKICSTLQRLLGEDHQVCSFSDPGEALDHLKTHPSYDLILCDLMMPEMTGMDFYAQLSEISRPLTEVLAFMTGGAFTPRARQFLELTPIPWLEKPLQAAAIQALLQRDRSS